MPKAADPQLQFIFAALFLVFDRRSRMTSLRCQVIRRLLTRLLGLNGAAAGKVAARRIDRANREVQIQGMQFQAAIKDVPNRFEDAMSYELDGESGSEQTAFSKLVENASSCSPYLRSLIQSDEEWVFRLAEMEPEKVLNEIIDQDHPAGSTALGRTLRRSKKRVALLTALADLGGVWNLSEVTGALTRFADLAVRLTLECMVDEASRRRNAPQLRIEGQGGFCHGMFALAMGKMGAFELNYSSDIDLILLFDERKYSSDDFQDVRSALIRVARQLATSLSDNTSDGYVFRTDLRLRPDPLVTPVCMSMGSAEQYYESFGRNWERGVYIKARPCAGDIAAATRFLEDLTPFVWRKNLDYAAVQDAREMRVRIRESKGITGRITLPGHNIKLGRGGIREIESFAQIFQIIAGGRDRDLRVPDTLGALAALTKKGWIEKETERILARHYVSLRRLEHRLQMVNDAQTHEMPRSDGEFDRIAALSGTESTDEFRKSTIRILEEVHEITEEFFVSPESRRTEGARFELSEAEKDILESWRKFPVFRDRRTKELFNRIHPKIFLQLRRSANPSEALSQFDGFLKGLPAGIQLFSLFDANPQLISLLTDICATAPGLASYLSQHSQIFDAVLDGDFFSSFPASSIITAQILDAIGAAQDYESKLDAARRFSKEQHFRIGVQNLRGLMNCEEAASAYSELADGVLGGLYPLVVENFQKRYGPPPGRGASLIAMGSLGAKSLTSQSDLDLIVIYDAQGEEFSTGKKSISARAYYARMTQAMVSALSALTAEGRLYSVDMRLRPSGKQGPVAITIQSFSSYQMEEAWTWEHLALTRARPVAGSPEVGSEIETLRRMIIGEKGDRSTVLAGLRDMRRRLAENEDARRADNPWEVRVGHGRLLDIELFAQAAALIGNSPERKVKAQLAAGVECGWLAETEAGRLSESHATLRSVMQVARLTVTDSFRPSEVGTGVTELLLREVGEPSLERLEKRIQEERTDSMNILSKLIA